jgi:predicted amidohydrolase
LKKDMEKNQLMLKTGFFQFHPLFGDVKTNLNKIISALNKVEADLVVLPELAFTGYYFNSRAELEHLAEDPKDSAIVDGLKKFCKTHQLYMVTGFAEKASDKVFNSALLFGPEGMIHTYRKLHLFNTEKDYFDPGDTPLDVISVRGIKIGLMVCFDWIFPEVARILSLKGADILCHPANLVLSYCQQAMLTRSLENRVFTITANRYGTETRPHGELTFTGQSQITSPGGQLLYRAKPDTEELHILEINIDKAREKKVTDRNDVLRDRRPSFYHDLIKPLGM